MHADRIEVFHVADGNAVVVAVAHDLILDFFPPGNAALDQDLANHGVIEALDDDFDEFFFIFRNAAAGAAHGIGRAHDDRIADFIGKGDSGGNIFNNGAFWNRLAKLLHGLLEELTVLRAFDCFERRAKQFHMIFFQNALFC